MSKVIKKIEEVAPGMSDLLSQMVQDKLSLDRQKKDIEERISTVNMFILTALQTEKADKIEGHGWNISQVVGSNAYLDPTKVKEALIADGMDADKVMTLLDACTKRSSYSYPSVKRTKEG